MTDNKLTDKEIIKALECCASGKNCEECSLNCKAPTSKDILDLINRQQAEHDELKNNYRETLTKQVELCDVIEKKQAEIERLQEELNTKNGLVLEIFENKSDFERIARIKAIKEVFDKIKAVNRWSCIDIRYFDKVEKEMVGEQE